MSADSLHVVIERASGLVAADSNGKSDPYVVVTRDGQPKPVLHKTAVIKKTLDPVWTQAEQFRVPATVADRFRFDVFDHDRFSKDDPLGHAVVSVQDLRPFNQPKQLVLKLQDVAKGELHVTCTFAEANPAPATAAGFAPPPPIVAAAAPEPPPPAAMPPASAAPAPSSMVETDPVLLAELGPLGATRFCAALRHDVFAGAQSAAAAASASTVRDYCVVLDKSGSMSGSRWQQATKAMSLLVPFACRADPDGIALYFFDTSFTKHENVRDADAVQQLFQRVRPGGGTSLAEPLRDIFKDFLKGGKKPLTVLVITDGESSGESSIVREIESISDKLDADEQLSITFVQIGNDSGAERFLKKLDDSLHCKFDIVDTLTMQQMEGMPFDELVARSLKD